MTTLHPLLARITAEAACLGGDEVGVWLADSRQVMATLAAPELALNPAERARAAGFRLPADRAMFVAAHLLARYAAAGALGWSPTHIDLAGDARGRPRLLSPWGPLGLDLSLSHSGGRVAIALMREGRCGVDLEHHRDSLPVACLSPLACSPHEQAGLARLAPSARGLAFLALWTGKEALLKGIGVGVVADLTHLSLEPVWPAPARLVADAGFPGLERGWTLWHGRPRHGLSLALAARRPRGPIRARFSHLGGPEAFADMHSKGIPVVMRTESDTSLAQMPLS
ncbi:MAG: 4'-phosphopantetheinyl transferase superfamily protein [Rhodocyclaceae bacterium]|nr:4'-phosphopantetheinyl transferase superfamily protein [Rhodocyclaceae bacterium]